MIDVKIIEKSYNAENGIELTTMLLTYPRFIHAELMTHRMFSRNASSSRAIPVSKTLSEVINNPAKPIYWGKNQRGMGASQELTGVRLGLAKAVWKFGSLLAVGISQILSSLGVHKQHANRITEPYQHITVVVTATDWNNFFELRAHPDAQPEIQELATKMRDAINTTEAKILQVGEWHLPFVDALYMQSRGKDLTTDELIKVSVAHCARTSYKTHDGLSSTVQQDIALYDRLVGSKPIHASPTEHQAMAVNSSEFIKNFRGWKQHRAEVENF